MELFSGPFNTLFQMNYLLISMVINLLNVLRSKYLTTLFAVYVHTQLAIRYVWAYIMSFNR